MNAKLWDIELIKGSRRVRNANQILEQMVRLEKIVKFVTNGYYIT